MGLVTIQPRNNGMGQYPTLSPGVPNPCYQPDKPWYMPDFLDTWDERVCAAGLGPSVNPDAPPSSQASALDSTISSLAGIAIMLGVAYLFLDLYLRKGR